MRGVVPFVCVLAVFGVLGSLQSPTTAVDLPPVRVDLPVQPVSLETDYFIDDEPQPAQVCVDGSCDVAGVESSGVSSSDGCEVSGPVRRIIEKKPVRRLVGRVFSRIRGCR